MSDEPTLAELRANIDTIDDEIHDLLMRRTDIVSRIGALKKANNSAELALRPGREAAIIRRLALRHRGPFPRSVIVRIWRELLSGQVAVQGAVSVAVFAPDGISAYRDLARDQFGIRATLTDHRSVNPVLQAVSSGDASIGVLPMPLGERPDPWWRGLVTDNETVPRVIARLPFAVSGAVDPDRTDALAIARVDPECTGDDVSLVAIETDGDISRDRMRDALKASGMDASWVGMWQDTADSGRALHLVSIDEYIARGEPRLDAFREKAGEAVRRAISIGGYARQLDLDDIGAPA